MEGTSDSFIKSVKSLILVAVIENHTAPIFETFRSYRKEVPNCHF